MENPEVTKETTQHEIVCKGCSSKLTYAAGTRNLKCSHCGTENEIHVSTEIIEELDFEKFANNFTEGSEIHEVVTVKCDACGAQTSFEANVVSGNCPFCGSPIVVSAGTVHHSIQPKSLLPFAIDKKKAEGIYSQWLKKLWWAPNDLTNYASQQGKLNGMYTPYWTYDAVTNTDYAGECGVDFSETEEYETLENGETVVRSRTVVRTIWYPVSGTVNNNFDDTLVVASQSLPIAITYKLEPWDLQNLIPFNPNYLAGYKTESYQIELKEGFEIAKARMNDVITQNVNAAIGGAHQRVFYMKTAYDNITFKHILLPLYINSYRYKNKVYRFLINGRTGEVHGERPYSWVKITLSILAAITILAILVYVI